MGKQLKTSVEIEGRWYRPGDRPGEEIPDADAEQIRNPKVWEYTDGDKPDERKAKPVGAQLAKRVDVDGVWYGPGDEIPADVAAKIRNPKAWEGGEVPAQVKSATATATDGNANDGQPKSNPDAVKSNEEPASDTQADTDGDDEAGKTTARRGRRS